MLKFTLKLANIWVPHLGYIYDAIWFTGYVGMSSRTGPTPVFRCCAWFGDCVIPYLLTNL